MCTVQTISCAFIGLVQIPYFSPYERAKVTMLNMHANRIKCVRPNIINEKWDYLKVFSVMFSLKVLLHLFCNYFYKYYIFVFSGGGFNWKRGACV